MVLEKLARRQSDVVRVSLRFDDEVIVQVRESAPEAPAKAAARPRRRAA
jgi:hypothetical protein